ARPGGKRAAAAPGGRTVRCGHHAGRPRGGGRVSRRPVRPRRRGRPGRRMTAPASTGSEFDHGLLGHHCWLELANGERIELPVERWAAPSEGDEVLLDACSGPTLDI